VREFLQEVRVGTPTPREQTVFVGSLTEAPTSRNVERCQAMRRISPAPSNALAAHSAPAVAAPVFARDRYRVAAAGFIVALAVLSGGVLRFGAVERLTITNTPARTSELSAGQGTRLPEQVAQVQDVNEDRPSALADPNSGWVPAPDLSPRTHDYLVLAGAAGARGTDQTGTTTVYEPPRATSNTFRWYDEPQQQPGYAWSCGR
jgi:hypothetical protein